MRTLKGGVRGLPVSALLLVGITTLVAGAAIVFSDTGGQFPVNTQLLHVFQTTALPPAYGALPPVVARVGGTDITSEDYARQVALIRNNNSSRSQPLTDPEIQKAAMDGLIRGAALFERAVAEGIMVSDQEVNSFMQDQRNLLSHSETANPGETADANGPRPVKWCMS